MDHAIYATMSGLPDTAHSDCGALATPGAETAQSALGFHGFRLISNYGSIIAYLYVNLGFDQGR